ncbi:hypothetical protein B296_00035144 [Ensete ventricosum]|uniref:Uncharacterized protein n=1 Tax=Ensete ventricosum TaxID=4639 RepID=A0A426XF48_ENSVE|nr:hypothetical protein B296_00035144 [Ensete ventricosum]
MLSACKGSWPQQGLLPEAYKRSPVRRQPTGKGTTRKGCHLQGWPRPPAGPTPAGVALTAGATAPWQGGCRRIRAVVACVGVATSTMQ